MPKRATKVILSEPEQEGLEHLTKRHRSEQQQVQRARIILAAGQGRSNAQIGRELAIDVDTVRLWRACKMRPDQERRRSSQQSTVVGWRPLLVKHR